MNSLEAIFEDAKSYMINHVDIFKEKTNEKDFINDSNFEDIIYALEIIDDKVDQINLYFMKF